MPPKIQQGLIQAGQPLRRDFPDPDAAGASPSGPVSGQCENELGVAKDGLENRLSCQAAAPLTPGSKWSLLGGAAIDRDPGVGDTFQYAAGIGYSGPQLTSQLQAGVFALPLTWNQPRSPVIDWNTQYRFNPTTEAHLGLAAATHGGATELNVGASHDFFKSETFDLLASAEYQRVSGREEVPLGSPQRVIATLTPTLQLNPQWSLELNARVNAGVGERAALMGPICDGWIAAFEAKPSACERVISEERPSLSWMSKKGESMGSTPQRAHAATSWQRALTSGSHATVAPRSAAMSAAPNISAARRGVAAAVS